MRRAGWCLARISGRTDYWAYGIEPNRHVLKTFARYAAAQHLIAKAPAPEDLFTPELHEDVII
jgi:4,5-dihydroxyphthalate decarboxylase